MISKCLQFIAFASLALFAQSDCSLAGAESSILGADFFVAPNGSDGNAGDASAPFKTVARARDAVRQMLHRGSSRNITVAIAQGTYPQTETLEFGPEDSGTDRCSITYTSMPGKVVRLSGGRRVDGWKKGSGGIWTTAVPDVSSGKWYFRQLFVNGRRATRARTPNFDDTQSWWRIVSSNASKEHTPAENEPVSIKVSGQIRAYLNPSDVELVYMQNNECGRKRVEAFDEQGQSITLSTPNRWNPQVFKDDWMLSIPFAGKPCYLENALEMLDQPGEWYLDRKSGMLHYWPLPGEDLNKLEVVAPVLENTMIRVAGSLEHPVVNLHFRGLEVSHVDWAQPPWGYMALFCCNVAVLGGPMPGHAPIEAAVEFTHAQSCSFIDGGVTHVGGMGICLRAGTSNITVEGNEVGDIGGGGIAAGWPNSAAGYLDALPPPAPGEFSGYRIANNCIHHCGMIYFGAVGVLMFPSHQSVISHNSIHDIAYIGIALAGSQNPSVTFDGDNVIEYNDIDSTMATTIDGGGIYVTFAQDGEGTRVRGNVVHDTHGNPNHEKWGDHPPSAGLYLDGSTRGGRYEDNILYRNPAAGPLIFDYFDPNKFGGQNDNVWTNNIFQKAGVPPPEALDSVLAFAGIEAAYRARLSGTPPRICSVFDLGKPQGPATWFARQFAMPAEKKGVIEILITDGNRDETAQIVPHDIDAGMSYSFQAYDSPISPTNVWGPGKMPMAGETSALDLGELGVDSHVSGGFLSTTGLKVKLGGVPRVIWIAYKGLNVAQTTK